MSVSFRRALPPDWGDLANQLLTVAIEDGEVSREEVGAYARSQWEEGVPLCPYRVRDWLRHRSRRQEKGGGVGEVSRAPAPCVDYQALDRDLTETRRTSTEQERREAYRHLIGRAERQERAGQQQRQRSHLTLVNRVMNKPVDGGSNVVSGKLRGLGVEHEKKIYALSSSNNLKDEKNATPRRSCAVKPRSQRIGDIMAALPDATDDQLDLCEAALQR